MFASNRKNAAPMVLIALFDLFAFGLLSLRQGLFDPWAWVVCLLALALLALQYWVMPLFFRDNNFYLTVIANALIAVGLVIQYRLSPDVAFKQLLWVTVGLVAMVAVTSVIARGGIPERAVKWYMVAGLGLLVLGLIFGSVVGGARNWIKLPGGVTFQPSELAKVLLVVVLAATLRERRSLLGYFPLLCYVALSVVLLVVQKDLGAALLYYGTFLILLYVATSNIWWVLAGLLALAVGGVGAYFLFDHVQLRVSVWLNPWTQVQGDGYQIAQGLIAIVSGGPFGVGLGLGSPKSVPAYRTDYIFAVICEEMGWVTGFMVIGLFVMLLICGLNIARRCSDAYHALLAVGCTVMLALQSFIILGGVTKLIPLTGITLPLVSYGGSSILSVMLLLGILQGVSEYTGRVAEEALLVEDGEGEEDA